MSNVHIRPASPDDLSSLVDFNCGLARETENKELEPDVVTRGVSAVLEDPARGRYLVAEVPGETASRVVGALLLTREWSDWRDAWFWWIQSVYVRDEARRHGVYRALHDRVVELASAEADVIGIRLYVERENERAQRTYERLGMARNHYHFYDLDLPSDA